MARGRHLDPDAVPQHLDRLFRAAWALCGSREDAEDLVQETIAKVLQKPRRLEGDDELGYLLRALRNTSSSQRRTASRRLRPGSLDDEQAAVPVDPSSALRPEAATEVREVFTAIAALAPDFRDALVAVDVAGLSYGEAGRLLGVREATITSRLHRARSQVARGMDPGRAGVSTTEGPA